MSPNPNSRMFLIDAMAMAFRNFHAFGARPLTTSKGLPTSAVYGCAIQLLKLIEDERPDYLVVATDTKEPTFRHEMYKEYKANRSEMPQDLAAQIPFLFRLFRAFGCHLLGQPGVEADDIIGTLVQRFGKNGVHCYIVSGDKDFLQLVNEGTSLYTPQKGEKAKIIGPSGVIEKFGCRADQVIDILALMGDSADNVPGVHGIGEKGAAVLIQKFGSLDGIYANLDDISNKRQREALVQNKEMAYLSQKLVTIATDVSIDLTLDDLRFTDQHMANPDELLNLFEELEFRSLHQKMLEAVRASQGTTEVTAAIEDETSNRHKQDENYRTIQTSADLDWLCEKIKAAEMFAFDTETTGLSVVDDKPIGMSFAFSPGEACYLPLLREHLTEISPSDILERITPLLATSPAAKVGHNLKFDIQMIGNLGLTLAGPLRDTMLAAWLLDAAGREHGLDACCLRYLNYRKIPTSELMGPKGQTPMAAAPLDKLSRYACEDADLTLRLYHVLHPKLQEQNLTDLYVNCESPLIQVLAGMERRGIYIDAEVLHHISTEMAVDIKELEGKIYEAAGEEFNINSTKQLQTIMFEKLKIHELLGIKRLKKTQSGFSTDVSVLEKLEAHPLPKALLTYRMIAKLKNTYVDTLPQLINPVTTRVHTSFHQTGTATGRLSSSDPNLQNIPIRTPRGMQIRKAFRSPHSDWVLISADYSQIELRILAHLSGDEALSEAFRKGLDIHTDTAARIFGVPMDQVSKDMRSQAKAINFGIIYGMGPQRLARETNVSFDEARRFIDRYFETFPRIGNYLDSSLESARKLGYSETLLGRRRLIPELKSKEPQILANAENIAVNSPVQGSAADLIKLAMIRVDRSLRGSDSQAAMLLQVHDELVFECPRSKSKEVAALIKSDMEHAVELTVPLVAEAGIGETWLDAH